jgi:hypothetical protein
MALNDVLDILNAGRGGNNSALALLTQNQGQRNASGPQMTSGGGASLPGVLQPQHAAAPKSFSESFLDAFKTGMDINATNEKLALESRSLDLESERDKRVSTDEGRKLDQADKKIAETNRANEAKESQNKTDEEGRNTRATQLQDRTDERSRLTRAISKLNADANTSNARVASGKLSDERSAAAKERGRLAEVTAGRLQFLMDAKSNKLLDDDIDIEFMAQDDDSFNTLMKSIYDKTAADKVLVKVVDPATGKTVLRRRTEADGMEAPANAKLFEGTAEKERAKVGLEFENSVREASRSADQSDYELKSLEAAFSEGYTGAGGNIVLQAEKWGQLFGIDLGLDFTDSSTIGDREAGLALSRAMALRLRDPSNGAGLPGQMSNQDREYLDQMVPGIGMTPAGRAVMIASYRKINERSRVTAKLAEEYLKTNDYLDLGFQNQLTQYNKDNPMFSADDQEDLDEAARQAKIHPDAVREAKGSNIGGINFGAAK